MKRAKLNLMILAVIGISLLALAKTAHADDDYNDGLKQELNQEVDQLYPKQKQKVTPHKVVAAQAPEQLSVEDMQVQTIKETPVARPVVQNAAPAANPQNNVQPIYILQQPASAPAAQVQPATTVEAPVVKESRADQLRKQREDVEHQTEGKLLEKLEDDRLLSEKDRSDKLFNPAAAAATPVPATVAVQQQAPVAQPVAVQVAPAEASSVFAAEGIKSEEKSNKPKSQIGGDIGIGAYPTMNQVYPLFAGGASFNLVYESGLMLTSNFTYSSYNIKPYNGYCYGYCNYYSTTTLTQYNADVGLGYRFLSSQISPVVGTQFGYTRRSYSSPMYQYSPYPPYNGTTGSNAFDGGLSAGVDVTVSPSLSVGGAIHYMMNISYSLDSNYFPPYGVPAMQILESQNYYFATINLKWTL